MLENDVILKQIGAQAGVVGKWRIPDWRKAKAAC